MPHVTVVNLQTVNNRQVRLNYIEVPFLFRGMLKDAFTGPFLEEGASISRMSSNTIVEKPKGQFIGVAYKDIVNDFKNSDISLVARAGTQISKKINALFRYTYTVTKFHINKNYEPPIPLTIDAKDIGFLRNYNISLFLTYRIL